MSEYNLLTRNLLGAGYTVDNYPEYVQICTSRLPGNDPLNNLSDGFVYKSWYRDSFIYKTGCGLCVKGRFCAARMTNLTVNITMSFYTVYKAVELLSNVGVSAIGQQKNTHMKTA